MRIPSLVAVANFSGHLLKDGFEATRKPRPWLEQITRMTGYSGLSDHWVALITHCPPLYSEKGRVFPLEYTFFL
jgi:hypothetical protein